MDSLRLVSIVGAVVLPLVCLGSACGGSGASPGADGGKDGSGSSSGGSGGSSGGSGGSSGGSGGSSGGSGGSSGSSGGSSGSSSGGSGSSSGGSGGSSGSSSGGSSGSSSGGPMTDQQCAAEGGQDCNDCCAANHNDGYAAYVNAIIGCECGPSGFCQAPCDQSFCMLVPQLPSPGDTCDNCLNDSFGTDGGVGPCDAPIVQNCQTGTTCGAYVSCADNCN